MPPGPYTPSDTLPPTALDQGLRPFIPGSVVKGAAAMLLGVGIAPWASRKVW